MKHSLSSKNVKKLLLTRPIFSNSLSFSFAPSNNLAIGFSLGRWSGTAVVRNKFKRVARKTFLCHQKNKQPLHVLIKTKTPIHKIDNLQKELLSLFNQTEQIENSYNG